jgi:hypothetical protein
MMSVITGKRIVFCEGKPNSLDYRLLNRLVETIRDAPTIVPASSKFTFSMFAQGYFYHDKAHSQKYVVFRDRDFDTEPTQDVRLLTLDTNLGNKNILLTYRSCIENYLIDAEPIHAYWSDKYEEKRQYPASRWGHGDSPGIEVIAKWIENSSKNIKDYQAVRWALSDLIRESNTHSRLKTTWTGGSGKLPDSLAIGNCLSEAINLIKQFRNTIDNVKEDIFKERVESYKKLFSEEDFWADKQYLIWFHGKDIQKRMQIEEPQFISLKDFFHSSINNIDLNQHCDLMEFKAKVESL